MQNCLVGVAFEVGRRHAKLKQLMCVAHCTYACTQTYEMEVCFATKVGS